MRYTIFVDDGEGLLKFMKNNKVFLGDWYGQGLAPAGVDYQRLGYNPQSCPVAENRAKMSVNLPLQTSITPTQAEEIIKGVKSFLRG